MKKNLLAMLLVVSIVIGMTACQKGSSDDGKQVDSGNTSSDNTTSDSKTSENGVGEIDTSEHVVITYMVTGDKNENGAIDKVLEELNKILTEKVNAELKIYYIGWTDYLSNYNLTLAQMDGKVDLIGTASDWLDAWPNTKNGAFLELSEELLKTYAPKTWESVPQEHWDMCKYNGDIYLMPENNYTQWTNQGFSYRLDLAREAGLTDGINNWEDMTTYFAWVKENKTDMIPWNSDGTQYIALSSGWVASHSEFVPVDGVAAGGLWGGTKSNLYSIISPFYSDTEMMVEFAKEMKKWDQIGVWKTDVLNNTAADNRQDFRDGKVAAEQQHTGYWTDFVSTIPDKISEAEIGFFYFGQETENLVGLSITHGAMAVSAASKNPERALMVYDLLRNDQECYNLFNYGLEGVQWEVNEQGLKVLPENYVKETDEIVINNWWGRNDDLEIRDGTKDWDIIDKLYAKYETIKIDYPYGQFVVNVDNIQSYINNINEIHSNYMKQIAYGKYNKTAEEIVAEYQSALKSAGFEEVMAELQVQFDELYK